MKSKCNYENQCPYSDERECERYEETDLCECPHHERFLEQELERRVNELR